MDLDKKISLNFKNADIRDVLTGIARESKVNIVLSNEVKGLVTIYMDDVSIGEAFKHISRSNNFAYKVDGDVIYVDKADLMESKELKNNFFYKPENIDILKLEEILKNYVSKDGKVVVDSFSGALIITDADSNLDKIKALVQQLDTPVKQIFIKTKIVETYKGADKALGIQWGGSYNDKTSYDFPYNVSVGGDEDNNGYLVNLPAASPAGLLSMGLTNGAGSLVVNAKLSAMQEVGDAKIVSEPSVVTMNNQKALIESGVEFRYRVTTTDSSEVEEDEAKLKMEVTPQVTPENNIIVKIVVNKDELDFTREVDGYPLKQTRKAETILKLEDGETTIIGGLSKNTLRNSKSEVPYLSKIPVLGNLFKSSSKSKEYDEIMIFITPSIIELN
jgi:type IV pilus assembly protein PilQ